MKDKFQTLYEDENDHTNAIKVFCDGSFVDNAQGKFGAYGVVIGELGGHLKQKQIKGKILAAIDNNDAEATAVREAIINTRGKKIILVIDHKEIANFVADTLSRTITLQNYPKADLFNRRIMQDLFKTLDGNRGLITAVYYAPDEIYEEQKIAHNLCNTITRTNAKAAQAEQADRDKEEHRHAQGNKQTHGRQHSRIKRDPFFDR